eukprot:TRINITY_DN5057_c0_g1_i1.p2 TRINITY_DN5057_c0_g1~~TRINITY_DN5057_c0_g1_i1.p2  ORF type:complete len:209 (+),score=55.95 TRINITY_DN5057_c0_g1_i1:1252-1878(+)
MSSHVPALPPVCRNCDGDIVGKHVMYSYDGLEEHEVHLHMQCKDAWVERTAPECDWCGKKIMEEKVKVRCQRLKGVVHRECVGHFTASKDLIGCGYCKGVVSANTGGIEVEHNDIKTIVHPDCEADFLHDKCERCDHCADPMLDTVVQITDPHSYGTAKLHPTCVAPFKLLHCPTCLECRNKILSTKYSLMGNAAFHDECLRRHQLKE